MAFVPFTKEDQPTMAAFNEKFEQAIQQAIQQAFADGVKIEVGSYVGTGTYGSGNKNSLTFGFEPKVVIVHSNKVTDFGQYVLIWVFGSKYATNGRSAATSSATKETYVVCSLSGTTLSWHTAGTSSIYQLNDSGTTYNYIAIG